MIEVQDKPARLTGQQRYTGSVPAVLPRLLPPAPASSALANEIGSLLLVVVMPTAFWCSAINAVRSLLGLETGVAALSCTGLAIAGFLLIIRASLMIDRSA